MRIEKKGSVIKVNGIAYEGDENRIARFDVDIPVLAIVDNIRFRSFAVQSECACETDAFHGVMQENIVRFWSVELRNTIDFWEVGFAFA